jgi:2-polyprenyl-3-methyl-5-hydroxy-6-metoxy-1,4-benzoquinol methylase
LNKKGKYLDIGAGIGEVPDVLNDLGWETEVTEMNPVAIEWLKTRKHRNVFHGPFDNFETQKKFDVISAWGVIEHVVNADAFLAKAYSLLEPGGLFVSEVPHADCLLVNFTTNSGVDPERILMGEQHIVLYSKKAYEELHKRNGFELVHIQTNGLDFSTIAKVCKFSVPDDIILNIQKSIDDNLNGDLLRGFWRKVK